MNGDCSDDDDIVRSMQSTCRNGNILARNFMACSTFVKTQLFKTFYYSLYCAYLWSNFSKTQFKRVNIAYNDVIRILFNLNSWYSISTFSVLLNINTFEMLRRRLAMF